MSNPNNTAANSGESRPALDDDPLADLNIDLSKVGSTTPPALNPDLQAAKQFLRLLDPAATQFCFQTFDDLESRKHTSMIATIQSSFDDAAPRLTALNKRGAGVFVTVNATNGVGRKEADVIAVRAFFADFDPPKTAAAPDSYPLQPHWQVESSKGKRHAYWLIDDCPVDRFKTWQQTIIQSLRSDPAPCDLPRVMRLPGFFHMKNPATPHLVRIVSTHDIAPYSLTDIAGAFSPQLPISKTAPPPPANFANPANLAANNCIESENAGRDSANLSANLRILAKSPETTDYLSELLAGENVHQAALKVIGRMVATGMLDADIRAVFAVLSQQVATQRGADRAAALMGTELERMISGARVKGFAPAKDAKARESQNLQPEPLRAPITASAAYPVEALGGVLGNAANALHETIKAPLALCAQSVLAAASFAAQAHFDVEMPWGETKPLSLALLTVGKSGERKSAVDDLVLGAAKAQERDEMEGFEESQVEFDALLAAWKSASEAAKKRAGAKDKGTVSDFIAAGNEVGPPPKPPILPLRFVSDPTVEGLFKLLALGQPSVALFSDEGGLLIGGYALNSDNATKTLARWCKLWDGSPFDRVRAGDGSGILYGRRMALHQLAQPEVMTTLLNDRIANGQGFLARCLVAWPESTIGQRYVVDRFERPGDRAEIRHLFGVFKRLFETLPRCKDQQRQILDPLPLNLTPDALAVAVSASNQFEQLMAPGQPLSELQDRTSKALDNAVRIAGILTVMDWGVEAREIATPYLTKGLSLVQWYLAEALRIRASAIVPASVIDAEALLAWLRDKDLKRFRSDRVLRTGPAQLRDKERMRVAIGELVSNGYLVENEAGTWVDGVKARVSWSVTPEAFNVL